jgi:uncharacterized protein (TIGR02246 family)
MQTKTRIIAAGVIAALSVAVPTVASAQDDETSGGRGCERAFAEAAAGFDDAFVARDFEGFMSYITDDAMQIDYQGTVFVGKDAIAEFTEAVMRNDYTFVHSLIAQNITGCKSANTVQDTTFAIPEFGVSLHLEDTVNWVRVHGGWKVSLIQNTEFAA